MKKNSPYETELMSDCKIITHKHVLTAQICSDTFRGLYTFLDYVTAFMETLVPLKKDG